MTDFDSGTASLLRRALADPFSVTTRLPLADHVADRVAIWDWARHLAERYPLASLRPAAYARMNPGELPSTHPLGPIIKSIVRDEGDDESLRRLPSLEGVDGLKLILDRRRCTLSRDGGGAGFGSEVDAEGKRFHLVGTFGVSFPSLLDGPVLASYEPDTPYSIGGYDSPYEQVGLQFAQLRERREAARPGTSERREAEAALQEFVDEVTLPTRGRPTPIRDDVARAIVDESADLIRVVSAVGSGGIVLSDGTRRVLAGLGIPERAAPHWVLRLTVPVLSAQELDTLREQRSISGEGSARELAVHILAHRLQMPASTIARKVLNGWKAESMDGTVCAICRTHHGL